MSTVTDADKQQKHARPSDSLTSDQLKQMLRDMLLIRRFEERCSQAYQQAKIGGFCHIYIGQEASAVGSISALRPDDPIVGAYRDHGFALARGMDPRYAMAEMFGKITGCSKGKGGSMHLFDKEHHMYGGHAIVGGQIPLGIGLAFGLQYEEKEGVSLTYLGDGALNQGAFHEAMNLAAIWNLPAIVMLENNMYSMGTHIARGTAMADDLAAKAESYGMRYAECDGMDVLAVYDCIAGEVAKTRGAKNPQWTRGTIPTYQREGRTPGPVFVNCKTYRFKGHSMSDPQKYRDKEEVDQYQEQQDPINRLVSHLIENNHAKQDEIDDIDKWAKDEAIASVQYANDSEDMPIEELFTDIYSNPFPPFKKGDLPLMLREKKE